MKQCWTFEPEGRPTFSQIVESLTQVLESMAGYLEVGAFGLICRNNSHQSDTLISAVQEHSIDESNL